MLEVASMQIGPTQHGLHPGHRLQREEEGYDHVLRRQRAMDYYSIIHGGTHVILGLGENRQ